MSSEFNYDARLAGVKVDKDIFNQRAAEVIENEKAHNDESVFSSRENFIEHYEEKIMQGKDEVDLDEFMQDAIEKGYLEDDETEVFSRLADADKGDGLLNEKELASLLGAIYDGAQEASVSDTEDSDTDSESVYEKIKVQPWGTGVDDCLSRIIDTHVEGIELYSSDYQQYLDELCRINDIKNPNVIWGEVMLPEMKRDENNQIIKDENGKIQFYSENELNLINKKRSENGGSTTNESGAKDLY